MSLGYFFANNKPMHQDLLCGFARPERVWLRDLMLLNQKNVLLQVDENRMAQCVIQAACNDLRALSPQEVFHFDFCRFLSLAHTPQDASHLFEEFLEDLSQTKARTWIYIQHLDELLLHDDPAAKALSQHLLRTSVMSECRLIATLRKAENMKLLESHYPVFYHHTHCLKLSDTTEQECGLLLKNAVRGLQRQHRFNFSEEVLPKLQAIVSRYVSSEQLFDKTIETITIAVARMEATRAHQDENLMLNLQSILQVLSDWEQIPVTHLLHDVDNPSSLREYLQKKVMGQEAAVTKIVSTIQKNTPPLFVFCGPKDSGKTRMSSAIARYYNGSERYLIEIDLQKHQGDLNWGSLLAPSPSVQSRVQSLLTVVKQNPKVLIVFRQIEPYLQALANLLLPLSQQAHHVQDDGSVIDFSGVKIALITADAEVETAPIPAPISSMNTANDLLSLVCEPERDEFPEIETAAEAPAPRLQLPEMLETIVTVIQFNPVSELTIRAIVQRQLQEYGNKVKSSHSVTIQYQDEVIEYLLQQVLHRNQGTKAVESVFQDFVTPAVEKSLLYADQVQGGQVLLLMLNDTGQLLIGQLIAGRVPQTVV
jgi:ATP-dependent Clp protease ATP-binding subunit ClpA